MPQLQNIVLMDRATTPVSHTFTPLDIQNGVASVVESNGVPIGNSKLSISLRKTPQAGKYKAVLVLSLPTVVTETINGVARPSVARTAYAEATFTFDATSTEQERKDLIGMFASSLDSSKVLVNDVLVKLQAVY